VVARADVLGVLTAGTHGSTFGGNPLACAVARASLEVLVGEGLVERSATLGARFKTGLEAIRSPLVREVRGRGLMLAVELDAEAGPARPVVEALRARGILAKDTHGQTIRFSPPLVITEAEIDWALDRIAATLA
jgi:ornithine--oxo-acid transaminase